MGNQHRELIVDRHERPKIHRAVADRDHGVERKDELVDAMPLVAVLQNAFRRVMHAGFRRHDIQYRRLSSGIPEPANAFLGLRALLLQPAMYPIEMRRVEIAFHVLQPVGFLHHDTRASDMIGGQQIDFEGGKRRRRLARPHVNPDHVVHFMARIGLGFHPRAEPFAPVRLFGRRIEANAVDVELPAVIGAAQAALFVTAEIQAGAPVRAGFLQRAHAAQ